MDLDITDNEMIDNYLSHYKQYGGAHSCLQLPKIQAKCYVINIDIDPQGQGTHWVCALNLEKNRVVYIDSFGQIPNSYTEKWLDSAKKDIIYNREDFQGLNKKSCGYFCMYFCEQAMKGRKPEDIVEDFSGKVNSNEKLLEDYFAKNKARLN